MLHYRMQYCGARFQVLNEVIGMLERVVPLMSHPSDAFLTK